MSLKIYLDDCAYSRKLRELLEKAGHEVHIPAGAKPPLTGANDAVHFAYARQNNFIILTLNPSDFLALHKQYPSHQGIFVVYQDNDITKDMSYREIVAAIRNLQSTDVSLANGFWVLNAYRW